MRRPTTSSLVAIGAAVGPAFVGAALLGGVWVSRAFEDEQGSPTCEDQLADEAERYGADTAYALAVSRRLVADHPQLAGIADAAADHEAAYRRDDVELASLGDWQGLTEVIPTDFVAMLVVLAEEPALASRGVLSAIEQVARKDEGMKGVAILLEDAEWKLPEDPDGRVMPELRHQVAKRADLIRTGAGAGVPAPCVGDD